MPEAPILMLRRSDPDRSLPNSISRVSDLARGVSPVNNSSTARGSRDDRPTTPRGRGRSPTRRNEPLDVDYPRSVPPSAEPVADAVPEGRDPDVWRYLQIYKPVGEFPVDIDPGGFDMETLNEIVRENTVKGGRLKKATYFPNDLHADKADLLKTHIRTWPENTDVSFAPTEAKHKKTVWVRRSQ